MADPGDDPAVLDALAALDKAGFAGGGDTQKAASGNVEQLTLLGAISGQSPADLHGLTRRGPGRPPGAANQKTRDRVAVLERLYGNPLQRLLKVAAADTATLAGELGLNKAETFKLQRQCDIAALPFMSQKLPLAVEVEDLRALLVLNQGGSEVSDEDIQVFEENQGVIEGVARELNADELNVAPKPLKDNEEQP